MFFPFSDAMDNNQRMRICVCYLLTAFLISSFIYILISGNLQSNRAFSRLREEVDEIAHMVLHMAPGGDGESKQLTEIIDSILKKRLAGIWDDIYTVKKRLKTSECSVGARKCNNAACSDMVEPSIERVNYASEELGARIENVEAEPVCDTNVLESLLGLDYSANPPVNMLRQSMEPGNCFAFKNNKSVVTVKLGREIFIEAIEVGHIPSNLSPTADTKSAPKSISVYGIENNNRNFENHLVSFVFENSPTQCMQLFPVQQFGKYRYVRFKFDSNHGNPNYTCVYRIAVYGKL